MLQHWEHILNMLYLQDKINKNKKTHFERRSFRSAITSEHFELGVEFLQEQDDDLQLVQCLRVDGTPSSLQSFLLQPVTEQTPGLQQELCVLDANIQ